MKKLLSYFCAISLALLVVAPPMDYNIPMLVNSFHWCYLVIAAGLLGGYLFFQKMHLSLKLLVLYLFISCFISQVPYLGFNAFILIVTTFYFYLAFQKCDFKIIINFIEASFWLEAILGVLQLLGKDTLLNFGAAMVLDAGGNLNNIKLAPTFEPVVLGSVMQYMRFASVMAVMSPFLIFKSRWYLIPIIFVCVITTSSSFAMSLAAGLFVYFFLSNDSMKKFSWKISLLALGVAAYAALDWGSFRGAIIPSNGGRLSSWGWVLKTWFFDTNQPSLTTIIIPSTSGLMGIEVLGTYFNPKWFLFGHGIDTFLPLFPVYKHDMNPFPQAHNCWLQFLWEIGLTGFSLIVVYTVNLIKRLLKSRELILLAGLACIGTNMFFAFPTRMTQTALLIVAFLSLCELKLKKENV